MEENQLIHQWDLRHYLGIPMATRSGDIDPAIIPYIMKLDNLGPEDIEDMLNKQSGAWGVSGVSSDYRDIEDGYNMGSKIYIDFRKPML